MVNPEIPDITIIGKYKIPKQSAEDIVIKLKESMWLPTHGFEYIAYPPGVIKLVRIIEPSEAWKIKDPLKRLLFLRDGYPNEMTLFLSPLDDENWLEVEAICVPVMHRKMGQNIQFLFPRQSIEDARRLCTDFMKGTMHILGAKVIREPEPESKTRSMRYLDFLYNTPTENNINRRIHEMLKDAAKRVLLVGWVDREFIGDISNAKKRGVEVRIVTKSRTGR